MKRKLLAVLLSVFLCLGSLGALAFAEGEAAEGPKVTFAEGSATVTVENAPAGEWLTAWQDATNAADGTLLGSYPIPENGTLELTLPKALEEGDVYFITIPGFDPLPVRISADVTSSETPSETPSEAASETPSETPSEAASETPSETPSEAASETPSETPSEAASETPSEAPSTTSSTRPGGASDTTTPPTGGSGQVIFWIVVMVCSAGAAAVAVALVKRREAAGKR